MIVPYQKILNKKNICESHIKATIVHTAQFNRSTNTWKLVFPLYLVTVDRQKNMASHPTEDAAGSSNYQTSAQLAATQAQVNDVVNIMRQNVERVMERDTKLDDLDRRANDLELGASQFESQARRVKQRQWWSNMKMNIIIGVGVTVLLIIIIFALLPNDKK